MKTETKPSPRSRAEIMAELASLPPSVQGKICSYEVTTSSGNAITYHKLQYWANGKNHSVHIPNDKLAAFKEAVENGGRAWDLLVELGERDTVEIQSAGTPLKNSRNSSSRAPRRSKRSSTPPRSR